MRKFILVSSNFDFNSFPLIINFRMNLCELDIFDCLKLIPSGIIFLEVASLSSVCVPRWPNLAAATRDWASRTWKYGPIFWEELKSPHARTMLSFCSLLESPYPPPEFFSPKFLTPNSTPFDPIVFFLWESEENAEDFDDTRRTPISGTIFFKKNFFWIIIFYD